MDGLLKNVHIYFYKVARWRGYYMRFHFGRDEIFSIRCLVKLLAVYMKYPEMKPILSVISMRSFRQK